MANCNPAYTIIRSRRRSLTMTINDETSIVVRAPHHLPAEYIQQFILKHQAWIGEKIAALAAMPKPFPFTREQEKGLRERARQVIEVRCRHYGEITGLNPIGIRISSAQTRWGSCSYKGNLNFNWRLILAPPEVIDYVVVHELVHLAVKNHSRNFWGRVAEIIPDYKKAKLWLRKNCRLLEALSSHQSPVTGHLSPVKI